MVIPSAHAILETHRADLETLLRIGHAKDTLAQVYLERSRRDGSSLARLRACLEQLTKGTDSAQFEE